MTEPDRKDVFLNVPFDAAYESLFVALVGTLVFLGQKPHCVLEVRESGDGRLARIFALMRVCGTSIHDLSRIGRPVRFLVRPSPPSAPSPRAAGRGPG
jgi:hypothetical protein